MKLSYSQYNKKFPQNNEYLKSHFKDTYKYKCVSSGMILWEDEPENWGGPWDGSFVAFVLRDHRIDPDLKSCKEKWEEYKKYSNTSKYNVPNSALERLGWGTLSDYWNMIFIEKEGKHVPCSRSNLNEEEIEILKNSMSDLEKIQWEINILKCLNQTDLNPLTNITIENPFSLYFFGTDDCSYTAVFENIDKAKSFLEMIQMIPRWSYLKEKAVFTN